MNQTRYLWMKEGIKLRCAGSAVSPSSGQGCAMIKRERGQRLRAKTLRSNVWLRNLWHKTRLLNHKHSSKVKNSKKRKNGMEEESIYMLSYRVRLASSRSGSSQPWQEGRATVANYHIYSKVIDTLTWPPRLRTDHCASGIDTELVIRTNHTVRQLRIYFIVRQTSRRRYSELLGYVDMNSCSYRHIIKQVGLRSKRVNQSPYVGNDYY